MAEVEFRHVDKVFADGSRAVTDLSLQVRDGELMVVVGPSGCGKSTLLRMLAGLEEVTDGEVMIDGETVSSWSPQRRNIAMVFQDYALYPHMTVRRNLEFPLRMMKRPKNEIQAQVAETARLLGLAELLDRKPKQLSGGQRQRVAMGRAVVRRPSVFLMDEPLSNLDAKLRVQIRTEIAALQARLGTTMIYVTHDQVEAMTLGQRVAVLRAGVLQQVATPQALYDQPTNVFVATFLGSPGMNLFPALVIREGEGALTLHLGRQRLRLSTNAPELDAYQEDQTLVLAGVRPEALVLPKAGDAPAQLTFEVTSVELLGHERLVYGRLPGVEGLELEAAKERVRALGISPGQVVARLPADQPVSAGTLLTLGARLDHIHLFALDGKILCRGLGPEQSLAAARVHADSSPH